MLFFDFNQLNFSKVFYLRIAIVQHFKTSVAVIVVFLWIKWGFRGQSRVTDN